jgi:hypothetical protein
MAISALTKSVSVIIPTRGSTATIQAADERDAVAVMH